MTIGQRIVNLREEKGLSQIELATLVKINRSVMNRIERGLRAVRDDELVAIANCLGVYTDYILTGKVLDGRYGVKGAGPSDTSADASAAPCGQSGPPAPGCLSRSST